MPHRSAHQNKGTTRLVGVVKSHTSYSHSRTIHTLWRWRRRRWWWRSTIHWPRLSSFDRSNLFTCNSRAFQPWSISKLTFYVCYSFLLLSLFISTNLILLQSNDSCSYELWLLTIWNHLKVIWFGGNFFGYFLWLIEERKKYQKLEWWMPNVPIHSTLPNSTWALQVVALHCCTSDLAIWSYCCVSTKGDIRCTFSTSFHIHGQIIVRNKNNKKLAFVRCVLARLQNWDKAKGKHKLHSIKKK